MCTGANKIVIPYKIDMGSEGNIMLWQYSKDCLKMLQKMNSKKTINGHIKLRTYKKQS